MKKLLLFLILAINTSPQISALTYTQKARAYFKICYGFAALSAGVINPIMGMYHTNTSQTLSDISTFFGNTRTHFEPENTIEQHFQKKHRILWRFKNFRKQVKEHLQASDSLMMKQEIEFKVHAWLQTTSGTTNKISSCFLIPFGILAIKSGYDDLKKTDTKKQLSELSLGD